MKATIFFATRNRPNMVYRTLENISRYCPNHTVLVGNSSSKKFEEETTKIITLFKSIIDVEEILYLPDPGCANVYSDLFRRIKTELAIVWADDMFFTREHENLIQLFDNPEINLVGLPMIDDISSAPSIKASWPKDKFGCALWDTPTGRCAHHSIVRSSYFQKYDAVYTVDKYIDNFFHENTTTQMRYWPSDGAYILHTRFDDETRFNMLIDEKTFRFPSGHPGRGGENVGSREEREEKIDD
jgi:hypothetical protein